MKKILAVVLSLMMVFSILPVASFAAEAVTLTHTQFVNAADRYEKFITRNSGTPTIVTADSQKLSPEEFLYASASAIIDLAAGEKVSVTYKKLSKLVDYNAREDITSGEINRGEYVALAKTVVAEIDSANKVPVCFGTTLGAISPKNLSYTFAKVIQYYRYNKTLPAAVEVAPWVGYDYKAPTTAPEAVTPETTTISASNFINAALRVKDYVETQKALPATTQVDGQLLTMGQFLKTAVKLYLSGATTGTINVEYANNPSYPVEALETGIVLAKADVDSLVSAIDTACTSVAPASVVYDGQEYGFNTLVYIVASAFAQIRANGAVSSLEVSTWEELSGTALPAPGTEPTEAPVDPEAPRTYALRSMAVMAKWTANYLRTYGADLNTVLDNGNTVNNLVSLELTKLDSSDALLTLANAVVTLNGLSDVTTFAGEAYFADRASNFESKENFTLGTVSKADYVAVAQQIIDYAKANGGITPETTYCTLGGLGHESTMLLLADVVMYADANNAMPDSIEITKTWADYSGETVATPVPTEAPATQAPATAAPTVAPTPDGVFTIAELATAATEALNGYTAGTPFYKEGIVVDGITVAQQNYFIIAAQAIQDIYNNKTTATYKNADYNYEVPTLIANYTLTKEDGSDATSATQALYMNYAIRQTNYMANNTAVGASAAYPTTSGNANGFAVTDYKGQMTYEAALLMFSRVLAAYAANGTLPASVALEYVPAVEATEEPEVTEAPATVAPTAAPTPDGVFTIAELAKAASDALNGYTAGTPFYKEGIEVDGLTVAQQNYFILAAQAVQDIYNGKTTATYKNSDYNYDVPNLVANYTLTKADGSEATSATQALYMNYAIRQTNYVINNTAVGASAAYPTSSSNANGFAVSDYKGQMTYEAALLMFSRVLAAYAANGTLPASVALEYVPAVEATEEPEVTEAPATVAPTPTPVPTVAPNPTGHPALSTVPSGTTFTVAQIAAAADTILSHYEKYSALEEDESVAKALPIGNYMITDQDWAYLAGYAINGLSGAYTASGLSGYTASTAVTYKKMGAANANANNSYAGTTLTVAEVAEAAWKACSNYGNNNGRVAASCGSVATLPSSARQLSYYSILMAEARVLSYYAANGSLPTSVSFDALDYSKDDADSNVASGSTTTQAPATQAPTTATPDENVPAGYVSINQIATAMASAYATFESTDKFPTSLTVGASKGLNEATYFALASRAIMAINSGSTANIKVKTYTNPEYPSRFDTFNKETMSKAAILYIAEKQVAYADGSGAGKFGNYTTFPGSYSGSEGYSGLANFDRCLAVVVRLMKEYKETGKLSSTISSWPSDYTTPTLNCESNNATIKAQAQKIVTNSTTQASKCKAIFEWVQDNVKYSYYSNTLRSALDVHNEKIANCCDHAHYTIALARSIGIPARYAHIEGYWGSSREGHLYAELYDGTKWVCCDTSMDGNSYGNHETWTLDKHLANYVELYF